MPVRRLLYIPHPVLNQRTARVKRIDASVRRLVKDMIDTMHDAHGVGLAANQIGVPLRVAVIQLPDDEEATVLINPMVVRREGEREVTEGCLSVPGYTGRTIRSMKVDVHAQGLDGKPFRIQAENDLLAQALEHETDHLDGLLFLERLVSRDSIWKNDDDEAAGAMGGSSTEADSSSK